MSNTIASITGTPQLTPAGGSVDRSVSELQSQIKDCKSFPAVVTAATQPGDPLVWCKHQDSDFKFHWSNRESDDSVVGVGVAVDIVGEDNESFQSIISRCRTLLSFNSSLRVFGGFRFQPERLSRDWDDFSAARFWLPRLVFDGNKISCVVLDSNDKSAALAAVSKLVSPPFSATSASLPRWTSRHNSPNQEEWARNIDKAIGLFKREFLEKIVLARKATFTFDQKLNAIDLAVRLAEATYGCYQFCFQLRDELAFLGASPERLFRREHRTLYTEAVAGTRPRGRSEEEDRRLADELLNSRKDQLEHQIVRKSIRQQLHQCLKADSLNVSKHPQLLTLARTQHLFSVMEANLLDSVSDGQLISMLHPTPAVGGYPTGNALSEIANLEPFDRGWYSAPVGWISRDAAEFAVAIRSGLVQGNELSLYSGAGIVPGSDETAEWNEVEHKLIDFLGIIGSP